jgi:PAS domain S-box-containing protein
MNGAERWHEAHGAASGRLAVVLGPLLALTALTAILAGAAGFLGWYEGEMLTIAAGVCAFMLALCMALLFRSGIERRNTRQMLESVEARMGGIVESAMDAIVAVDDSQSIVLFNAAAENVFGYRRTEVIGHKLDMLIPARFHKAHKQHIERFGATGTTSRRMGEQMVLWGLRASGEEFPIEASIAQHSEGDRRIHTVILRDVTARVQADEALQRSREELRELAAAAHSVREQEKSRIARELHDELAQALTALKIDVNWVRERLPEADPQVAGKLASMQGLLDSTVAATRRISSDLRPLMLDDLGLVPAAEWLVQNFTQRTGISCELAIGSADLDLQDPFATAVYRILQESLTNVARHAAASQVEITIEKDAQSIVLTVTDNGRGFTPGNPRKPGSFGLLGLRERAHLLGGSVHIDSVPGRGTRIEVRIPITEEKSAS